MTGFAFPEVLADIWRRHSAGDRAGGRDVFHRWLPLIKFEAQPVIGLAIRKELLRRRGALRSAALRRPGPRLDPGTLAELEVLLSGVAQQV
jgi:4-hydroxy-tetrahydrodipicolinate synthase